MNYVNLVSFITNEIQIALSHYPYFEILVKFASEQKRNE